MSGDDGQVRTSVLDLRASATLLFASRKERTLRPLTVTYTQRSLPKELAGVSSHPAWFEGTATGEAGTFTVEGKEITFFLVRQSGMPYLPWFLGYEILPSGERFVFLSDAIPEEFRPFMAWHEATCTAREHPEYEYACYAVMEHEFMLAGSHLTTEGLYDKYVVERTRHFELLVEYMRTNADMERYRRSLPAAEYALKTLLHWLAQADIQLHPV